MVFSRVHHTIQPVLWVLACAPTILISTSAFQFPLHHAPGHVNVYPDTTAGSASWALEQGLDPQHGRTHSIFAAVKAHLSSTTDENGSRVACLPFVMRPGKLDSRVITFGTDELEVALASDYLDAGEGQSSDAPGGWRIRPAADDRRGRSFQDSRLHWSDVEDAKGTVVFNSAGAYISSTLAASALAALHGLDGAASGVCLNMYVTKAEIQQSAPPHTDKQDVVVVQTQGRKRWRIFSPPDNAVKPSADPFARGKGDDDLPVSLLYSSGSELLLDVTLRPGDVLFVPARFPHTTDTLDCYGEDTMISEGEDLYTSPKQQGIGRQKSSIHLTVGLDSHVWSMNYMSMRSLGLRRFGKQDVLTSTHNPYADDMDLCTGKVNQLSKELREGLFSSVDDTLISAEDNISAEELEDGVKKVAMNLLALNERVNLENSCDNTLNLTQCVEVVEYFRGIAQKILNTHKEMYAAAVQEEDIRVSEDGEWVVGDTMTKDRSDRLSIFRVPIYIEQLDGYRDELRTWGMTGGRLGAWAASQSIVNGDQVEANLDDGVSWLSAKVVEARLDGLFDLQLFDGRVAKGVKRDDMKGPHGIGIFI